MKLDILGKLSVTYEPGLQSNIEFWTTLWYANCTLATRFPQLYSICSNKSNSISEVVHSQGYFAIHFRRSLGGILLAE